MFLFQFEEAGTINMFPIFCQFFDVNVEGCIWKFCNDCNVLILDNVFAKLENVVKNYDNNVFSYQLMANFQTIHYMYAYNYVCNNTIFKQRLLNPEFVNVNIPSMYTVYIQLSLCFPMWSKLMVLDIIYRYLRRSNTDGIQL